MKRIFQRLFAQNLLRMKLISPKLIGISVVLLFSISCDVTSEIENYKQESNEEGIENLNVPSGFDFETYKEVQVTITDKSDKVKYDVFVYSEEEKLIGIETFEDEEGEIQTESVYRTETLNQLVFSGITNNGILRQSITLPNSASQLYIRRRQNLKYTSRIVSIENNQVNLNDAQLSKSSRTKSNANDDLLYAVNGSGELFQIDPVTGGYTLLANMPMGSYTCAIDKENKVLYSIGRSNPNPLMKYSIENNTWETIGNIGVSGPRLDFNPNNGLLYFSKNNKLHTIDPLNGNFLDTWDVNGLHKKGGGDIVFASDDRLFLCSFSGVYRLDLDTNNEYQSTRISDENLPFDPTSMTFDSSGKLWLANKSNNSDLISMNVETGVWQYEFGVNANNGTEFNRAINDLASMSNDIEEVLDTDGDGVADVDDVFPNNVTAAFQLFTPSENSWGTLAFEDLWPSTGDYDFNDLALKYRFQTILNSENKAVELRFMYEVKSNGASLTNGFGIEFENISPLQISNVTGLDLKHNYVNLASNGTELNQDNTVIVAFDDAASMLNKSITIVISFSQPLSLSSIEDFGFNPFMIINKIRSKEVHLPLKAPTSLGENIIEIQGYNRDEDGDYLTQSGLPWAINVATDFKVPEEQVNIIDAYNFFGTWATSGGASYVDWYQNLPGHINLNLVSN